MKRIVDVSLTQEEVSKLVAEKVVQHYRSICDGDVTLEACQLRGLEYVVQIQVPLDADFSGNES